MELESISEIHSNTSIKGAQNYRQTIDSFG